MAIAINEALQKKVVEQKLRVDALVNDPLANFTGSFNASTKQAPVDAATIVVSSPDTTEFDVGLVKALTGNGVVGRESALGNEEDMSTVQLKINANSWGNAVSTETYGVDFVRQNAVKVYSRVQPELSRWSGQMLGQKKRQALNEIYSYEQTEAPVSRTLGLNANIYAINSTGLVARSGNLAAYNAAVSNTIDNISAAQSSYHCTLDGLNLLSQLAQTAWQIEPLVIDGSESYLVILPFNQFRRLFNSGSGSYTDLAKYDDSGKIINGMAAFKYSNLIIMADPRFSVASSASGTISSSTSLSIGTGSKEFTVAASSDYAVGDIIRFYSAATPSNFMEGAITALVADTTITVNVTIVGGSGGPFTDWRAADNTGDLLFSYKNPAGAYNVSPLANQAAVGYLLGKGALYDMVNEDLHFEKEDQNYGRDRGVGAFCTRSFTCGQFNDAAVWTASTDYTGTDIHNKSSVVLLFANA